MPVFRVRLEATDGSGHFRKVRIQAESKAEAEAVLKAREEEYVLYRLATDEISAFEQEYGAEVVQAALALGKDSKVSEIQDAIGRPLIPQGVRGKLTTHRQQKPFEIAGKVEEEKR